VRLVDIMSSMQLGSYAEVALLLFLGAFGAIVVSVFWSRDTKEWERCCNLPLDGGENDTTAASGALTHRPHSGNQEP